MGINLGLQFAQAVIQAAGLDPAVYEPDSLTIDMVPDTGQVTIRVTRTAAVDLTALRKIVAGRIKATVTDPPPTP